MENKKKNAEVLREKKNADSTLSSEQACIKPAET